MGNHKTDASFDMHASDDSHNTSCPDGSRKITTIDPREEVVI